MTYFLLLILFLGFPALMTWLSTKSKIIDKIGVVVICYILGLLIGSFKLIPETYNAFQNDISGITIALGIPLIMFSSDIKQWFKLIGKTISSLILGVISVVVFVYLGYFIFSDKIESIWQICGMLVGVYTGGTPNMAAIKEALSVDQNIYIITHTSDLIVSSLLLFFILSIGKKFFNLFLPKFTFEQKQNHEQFEDQINEFSDYKGIFAKQNFKHVISGVGLSLIIVGISFALSKFFKGEMSNLVAILVMTTLGLAASFVKKIRSIKKTFPIGMYFIYVFCFIIASMADLTKFFQLESINIFLLVLFVVVGSFIFHALLSKIFKVDTDTFIISTVGLVLSVPFVPVVASALKNKHIIISGIVVALIGYAIGNYLGIFVAYTLK